MVCLDTTFIVDLIRKDPVAEKRLRTFLKGSEGLPSTTVITLAELFYGAYKSQNLEEEKAKITQGISGISILEMDQAASEKFGEILSNLERRGQKISERDILIAAIALSKGENTIVTRNKRDFGRISNVRVLTY